MKKIFSRNKSIALLLFLFGYNNLFGYASGQAACRTMEERNQRIAHLNKQDWCSINSISNFQNLSQSDTYIYTKIPNLEDAYFNYPYPLDSLRKYRAIPILIEFDGKYLNPNKEYLRFYQASSKYKEDLIKTNSAFESNNCLYLASGSEYLFPVPAQTGNIRIIVYYNVVNDKEVYKQIKWFAKQVKYYEYRSLFLQQFTFEPKKKYELKIEVNQEIYLPDLSSIAVTWQGKLPPNVNGFNISIQELPPNTKFAFDGKDDIGKTYEQVKKEFILYDKSAEGN